MKLSSFFIFSKKSFCSFVNFFGVQTLICIKKSPFPYPFKLGKPLLFKRKILPDCIPSSILICDEHCYIEPYLPINLEKRYEKGMLTFEVKVSNKSYLYNHNKDYFEFLWKIADDLSEFESNEQTYKNLVVNKINAVKEY